MQFYEDMTGDETYPPRPVDAWYAELLEVLKTEWGIVPDRVQDRVLRYIVRAAATDAQLIDRMQRPRRSSNN